jgi:hypothetical protein
MEYLDDLVAREGPDSDDWQPILSSLDGSRVASAFQGLGYRYDHIGSWWEPTREDPTADRNYEYGHLSEFTSVLLDTTIWPTIARKTGVMDWMSWEETQYHRVLYQFDAIESISHDPRPTFTFVHFTLPHFPYVFDAEGHYVSREELYRLGVDEAYLQQLEYTNVRVRQLVTDLLAGPDDRDPIIVLQSDEGPHPAALEADQEGYVFPAAPTGELAEKLRVLNAYFLPGNGTPRPYDTISPVNTFRLIFDRYFGADLPLLEDRTYVYFDEHHPYQLTDVTSRLRSMG